MRRVHERIRERRRLVAQHVEAGCADVAALERGIQGRLVDQRAARDVDEDRTALHRRERACVDEVLVRGRSRYTEYDAVGAAVARLQPALRELAQVTPAALEGLDRERFLARCRRYVSQGFPARLAGSLAALEPLRIAPDMVALMASSRASARAVARAHFGLGARLGLDWLHGAIEQLPANDAWQRAATLRLRDAGLAAHLRISAAALRHDRRRRSAPAPARDPALDRWQQLQRDLRVLAVPDLAALTVAVEALENLAAARTHDLAHLL